MSLLTDLMRQPVDADYAAAARRRSDLPRPESLTRSGLVLVVAIALGLLLSGAVVGLRAPAQALQSSRAVLLDELADRSAQAEALSTANAELSGEIDALQQAALAGRNPELLARLETDQLVSGAAAVAGPGLVIQLADAPSGQDRPDPESRVQDLDLQVVVNGLWAAGAEAISVNDVRLTSLSAIRSAGQAILVDLVPLSSPYTVQAVGDPTDLQTAFARTSAASHLALLASTYGIDVRTSAATELVLDGTGSGVLRHATVLDVAQSLPDDQEATP